MADSKTVYAPEGRSISVSNTEIRELESMSGISKELLDVLHSTSNVAATTVKTFEELKINLEDIRAESGNIFEGLTTTEVVLTNICRSLHDALDDLGRVNTAIGLTKNVTRDITNEAIKLSEIRETGTLLSNKDLDTHKKKLEFDKARLEIAAERLGLDKKFSELLTNSDEIDKVKNAALQKSKDLRIQIREEEEKLRVLEVDYNIARRSYNVDAEKAAKRGIDIQKKSIESSKEQLESQKALLTVLDAAAATESLISKYQQERKATKTVEDLTSWRSQKVGLESKFLSKVGLSDIAEQLKFAHLKGQEASKSVITKEGYGEDALKKAKEEGETVFDSLKPSLHDIASSITNAIVAGLVAGLVSAFNEVDKAAVKLKQNIGTWEIGTAAANLQFATAVEWLEAATHLAEKLKVNTSVIFTQDEIGKMAEAQKMFGLSQEAAGNLATYTKIIGSDTVKYTDNIEKGWRDYNGLHRTAVNQGQVLRETLNTSDAIRLSIGGSGEALAEAAAAALSMGMNLEQVQKISQNLINFESSIESEMTAQLLTGQQMNLAKARELALNNDLKGVADEIRKQGVDTAKFGSWNVIQQENFAKALGMSREELAKSLIVQELHKGLTEEQVAANLKMQKSDIAAISSADAWKDAINKIKTALTPLVKLLASVADAVTYLLNLGGALVGWVGSLFGVSDKWSSEISGTINPLLLGATLALPMFFKLGKAIKSVKAAGIGLAGVLLRPGSLKNAVTGQGGKAGVATGTAGKAVQVGQRAGAIPNSAGKKLTTLGGGIAGFFASLEPIRAKTIGTAIAATAALLPILTMSPAIALLSVLGPGAQRGLPALGRGIAGFFRAIGSAAPAVGGAGMVILLLGTLAVAMGGAVWMFSKIAPVIEAVGNVISKALSGLSEVLGTAFEGIGNLLNTVTFEKAGAIAALGGALFPFAAGLGTLGATLLLFPASKLEKVGNSLAKIGEVSASKVENFGTAAVGEIEEAETKVQTVKTRTANSQRAEIQQNATDLSRIEDMLGKLVKLSETGKNIYLNGDRVGQTLAYSTTRM